MKLHLPKQLFTALLAALTLTAPQSMADSVSVNFYKDNDDKISTTQGTLFGVDASAWNDVTATGAQTQNLSITTAEGQSLILTLTTPQQAWQSGNSPTALEDKLQNGYLDLGANNQWTITLDTDFWFSDVTFYMAGDGDQFSPISVNGISYVGGCDNEGNEAWGNRGTYDDTFSYSTAEGYDGTAAISNDNLNGDRAVRVTSLKGGIITASNVPQNDASKRGTIGGFQVVDVTDSKVYAATLGSEAAALSDVSWSKQGVETPSTLESISESDRYLSVTADAAGSTLDVAADTTIAGMQLVANNLTVDGSGTLTVGALHAKNGSTLTMNAALAGESLALSGSGTISLKDFAYTGEVSVLSSTTVQLQEGTQSAGSFVNYGTVQLANRVTPGIQISNNGNVIISAGTNNVNLNSIFNAETGITQTATGTTTISGSGTISMSEALTSSGSLAISGTGTEAKATFNSTAGLDVKTLVLENATATISGNEQKLASNITLNSGATLTINRGDLVNFGGTQYTWTVNEGATLNLGTETAAQRQTLARNFRLILAGGVVNGKSDGHGALDYYNNGENNSQTAGTIQVTKSSTLNAAVRARFGVVNFQIDGSDTVLTMGSPDANVTNYAAFTGGGSFKISGEGTLLYKGAAFTHALAISSGVFEYNTGDARTHTGAISGSGTFRKSGSGTLTLSGTLGTESARLGTVSATGGELAISGAGYVSTLEISGDADVRVVTGGNLNVTTFKASTGSANTDRNVYIENGATVTAATLNVSWNMGSVAVNGALNVSTELFLASNNRNNTERLLTGTGVITASKLRAGNWGSYGINVTTLNIGTSGLVIENGAVLNLASTTTTVAGTTTVNSGSELNFNAGSATLNGGISGTGTVALTGGSLTLGSGENITNTIAQFNYSGGTLSHSGLTVTNATFSGCTLVNTGALTLNGTLNIVNQEALTESGTVSYSDEDNGFYRGTYYVVQSAENSGASLTTGDNFALQLAGTAISGTSGNNSSYWSKDESGNLLLTLQDNAGTYFVNTGTVKAGGTAADDGTDQASRFTVADGATLQLQGNPSDSLTAGQALITTTGEGNITLGTDASIAASSVSQATGKLTITSGAKLTMDAGTKTSVYNLSSFTSVELDGGTIQYHGDATTLNNVTVTEKGAHISFRDVNTLDNAMTLAGTTTLNGTLTLDTLSNDTATVIEAWKYGVDIARLTGTGTLDIHSTDYSGKGGETARVSIQDLSGFTGNISLSKHVGPAQLNLNNLSGTLSLKTIAMDGGAQTTLSVNADTKAAMATVISGNGSVTKQGAGTLTLSGTNTYTGSTTVESGTLQIAGVSAISSSSSVSIGSGAELKYTGSGSETLGKTLSGAGSFTMAGTGTLTLSGANTYTGATTVESGTLQVAGLSAINSSSGISIGSGAELKYTGSGNETLSKTLSGAGSFTMAGTGTLTVSTTFSKTLSGITIESGTLKQAEAHSVLGEETNVTVKNGATLDVNGKEAYYNLTLGGGDAKTAAVLTNTGGTAVDESSKQLYSITLADDATVTGDAGMCMVASGHGPATLNLAGYTLTKTGSNTFTISRAAVSEGTIKVLQGTVLAKQAGNSGEGSLDLSAASVYVGNQGNSTGTFELDSVNKEVKNLTFDGGTVSTLNEKTLTATGTTQVKSTGGTLSGNLTANEVSFENGGTLKLAGQATVTTRQGSADAATMSKVQMNSTGITGTAQDGSSSISDADIKVLAQDASFTIQDMTLTNTSITAASVNIVDSKVSGNVVLNVVKPTEAITAPNVSQGGTEGEISFSYGLALVNSSSSLTLNMEVPQAILPSESGLYTLTITLNGFAEGFEFNKIDSQVVFGADSWLGEALTGASTSVTVDGETISAGAAAAQSSGAPSVSYNATSASDGNVGSLVITINGLNVPEPASATLGLAALMMLCARRRRRND